MQIRSSYALIVVRGTQFFADRATVYSGSSFKIGMIEVSAAGATVTLSAGQGTNLQKPGDAPTPPVNWGQARIDAAYE